MAMTVVGLYDDYSTARQVVRDLEQTGFGEDHLYTSTRERDYDETYHVDADDLSPKDLERYGVPGDETHFYAEGLRRGGTLVMVRVHDDDAETAAEIMARHSPVQYEQRMQTYREEGFTGYDADAGAYDEEAMLAERERFADEKVARMKEVEEELKVGKRGYIKGGVRLHKYVDTDVVEETLRLREEHVDVDRRHVDRNATDMDLDDVFEEEVIEMTEYAEEAVVDKTARVVGEVAIGKEIEEHTEVISDTVRKTRVEVEQLEGDQVSTTGTVDFDTVRGDFRKHYDKTYSTTDYDWNTYEPAYRFGCNLANKQEYRNRRFEDIEPEARRHYVERHDESLWEETKDAVRHAYNRTRAAF